MTFVHPDLRIDLGPAAALGLEDGEWSTVALGVRAEDVTLHSGAGTPARTSFSATIGLTEPIGSDTFVELDAGAAMIVARVDPDLQLSVGQKVTAELRPSAIHLFSRESGQRINS